jgi:signal transduction histidine kinase
VIGAALGMTFFGLAIGTASYVLVSQSASASVQAILTARVDDVVEQINDSGTVNAEALDLGADAAHSPVYIQVVDDAGTLQGSTPGIAPTTQLCPIEPAGHRTSDAVLVAIGSGAPVRMLREVAPVHAKHASVRVCAVVSEEPVRRAQSAAILALAVILPLVVGGVCLAVWFAIGRALRAVDGLRSQADSLEDADGLLVIQPTGDEVERLGETLNSLLDHLHQRSRTLRQFVADAGHELRNPLATVRLALEFGSEAPEAELRENVQAALSELDRLDRLVQDLLALARADAIDTTSHFQSVDLDVIAATVVDTARLTRPDLRLRIDADPCTVLGDATALRSLIGNLLDNACRHARSEVTVRVTAEPAWAELRVDDDGAGIPVEDCARVFDRFVRRDDARVRDEGGSGLGLAIVAAVAGVHGGAAVAEPAPGGHIVVRLPMAPPAEAPIPAT